MRRGVLTTLLILAGVALGTATAAETAVEPASSTRRLRIVSLNPSLTEILLSLDAADSLVGVDDYSARQQPSVAELPRVGGLFSPNLEAIVALEPDAVVVVPAAQQRDLGERLKELGIRVVSLPNHRLEEVLTSITELGALVNRIEAAAARVAVIRRAVNESRSATSDAPHPRTVMVIQRDPLYVVGAGSYLHELLDVAGARNLAAGFSEAYPKVGLEWLLAAAPDVILDASPDPVQAEAYWSRWPSLPAVGANRIVVLPASAWRPGPFLEESLQLLADALRPTQTPVAP